MIARVSDVDVAGARMRDYAVRLAELGLERRAGNAACPFIASAGERHHLAIAHDELADQMIARISNEDVVVAISPEVFDTLERRRGSRVIKRDNLAIRAAHPQPKASGDE